MSLADGTRIKIREYEKRIVELEQLLACEKTALEDEKAAHALTRAENQRLREAENGDT